MADRIDVLFLIDVLPAQGGGAERALLRTVANLPAERFRCHIGALQILGYEDLVAQLKEPPHFFPAGKIFSLSGFYQAMRLWRLIRRKKISLLVTFFPGSDFLGFIVGKAAGIHVISNRRDMGIFRQPKHEWFYRHISSHFDQIHAVSEQVRQFTIANDRIPPDHVKVIYNGVDVDRYRPPEDRQAVRHALGFDGASHVIVSVGNIRRVKGFDLLIESAATVCREFPGARYVIVGHDALDGMKPELSAKAEALGVGENIVFAGPAKEVLPYLQAADAFCLLSRSEGFSNAVVEAMACSLPAVVTNVGGNPEAITDGTDGYIVPIEDAATAADRVLKLLRDGEFARRMGEAARRTVEERFSIEVNIRRIAALYEEVLKG